MAPPVNNGWLSQTALDFIVHEASSKAPLETGGVLMGYIAPSSGEPVVLCATGPGPEAAHSRYHYSPDQEYDENVIAAIYKETGRRLAYLGDWHTHPAPVRYLSYRDRRTLKRIAKCPTARARNPLMLILSFNLGWTPAIWRGSLVVRMLGFTTLKVDEIEANVF